MITFTTGSIFESGAEALVNPVNCCGVMGAGLALEFKKRFPLNFEYYREICLSEDTDLGVTPGKMLVHETRSDVNPLYIINFPTKLHWKYPSKIQYISEGLKDLKDVIAKHNIKSIAIPALGCGLGGLRWEDVKSEIEHLLGNIQDIDIYVYAPNV